MKSTSIYGLDVPYIRAREFYADKHLFDFSGYEKESPFYNDGNKKVISKMKDELNGEFIEELIGLRAKIYQQKAKKGEMKKAKGVKKNVVKKYISHQDYVDFLFEERKFIHTSTLHHQAE